ncbi:MAG TPA: CopG family transcriptional regulator [Acidimicrobiia bacterium]|nr:CopG family transcriptional regulator [Acidimicrobiia bacterium]
MPSAASGTTVTLDDDVAAQLKRVARERGISFKEALNRAVRAGLGAEQAAAPAGFVTPSRPLGLRAGIDVTKAVALVSAREDEEPLRRLELRK